MTGVQTCSSRSGVGRAAESAQRSFQLAAVNKVRFGALPEDSSDNDNFRIRRYLAKVTINPAICFGVSDYVGSITPGKLADLVFWRPHFFIAKPEVTVKGGFISHAVMGDPNGSLMTGQPLKYRPQYGSLGANASRLSYSFVTKAAIENGLESKLRTHQTLMPVRRTRTISKRDLILNDYMPNIEIDPETYNVYIDGERITVKPAKTLPLTQLFYFR